MCKSEIFAEILGIVSRETEISSEKILSGSRRMEVVDARCILVKILSEKGLYPSFIASILGCTARTVQYILTRFSDRKERNPMMRINYENIEKQTGNKDLP